MNANDLPDPSAVHLPVTVARYERIVEQGLWDKLFLMAGRIPFAEDLAAAYYCVRDPATPAKVKGILLTALAYFVLPVDAIPDIVPALGFTDDAAVLAFAIGLVSKNIEGKHRKLARARLGILEPA